MEKNAYMGVSSVARKIKQPNIGVSGLDRIVSNGYIGVSGISRQFYMNGTPTTTSNVGNSVYMNVNEVSTEFIIVHVGNPDTSKYDSSCNGTWVMQKDLTANTYQFSNNQATYVGGALDNYLNNTYLKLLDTSVQNAIINAKIPYDSEKASDDILTNGLSRKIFSPSFYELREGMWDYFPKQSSSQFIVSGLIAYSNGTAQPYWTRTMYSNSNGVVTDDEDGYYTAFSVGSNGSLYNGVVSMVGNSMRARPTFILPLGVCIDENNNIVV